MISLLLNLGINLYIPLAGGPVEIKPTLFLFGFDFICSKMIDAPGKSAVCLLRLAKDYKQREINQ